MLLRLFFYLTITNLNVQSLHAIFIWSKYQLLRFAPFGLIMDKKICRLFSYS